MCYLWALFVDFNLSTNKTHYALLQHIIWWEFIPRQNLNCMISLPFLKGICTERKERSRRDKQSDMLAQLYCIVLIMSTHCSKTKERTVPSCDSLCHCWRICSPIPSPLPPTGRSATVEGRRWAPGHPAPAPSAPSLGWLGIGCPVVSNGQAWDLSARWTWCSVGGVGRRCPASASTHPKFWGSIYAKAWRTSWVKSGRQKDDETLLQLEISSG